MSLSPRGAGATPPVGSVVSDRGVGVSSYGVTPGTTVTSRVRALSAHHQRDVTSATVKEVDVVRRGLRSVETRIHQLESRVQHVNPWVVQHMWETLCEVKNKLGLQHSQREAVQRATDGANGVSHSSGQMRQAKQESFSVCVCPTKRTTLQSDDGNDDANNLNASVSSESDDNSSSGLCGMQATEAESACCPSAILADVLPPRRGGSVAKNVLRVVRQLPLMEWQWQRRSFEQQECVARQRIALDENTYRNTLIMQLAGAVCSCATAQRCNGAVASSSWRHEKGTPKATRSVYKSSGLHCSESSSDGDGIFAPTMQKGGGIDSFFGSSYDSTTAKMEFMVREVLNNSSFMDQVTSNVSQRLASLIQQNDAYENRNVVPQNALPSALVLAIRDAVEKLTKSHDEAVYQQVLQHLKQQQEQRGAEEERLRACIVEHENAWTRRAERDRSFSSELLEKQQHFVAQTRENAETCSEVRKEMVKLCTEVVRAAKQISVESSCALASDSRDGGATELSEVNPGRYDVIEYRLDLLSTAMSQFHGQLEGVRLKTEAAEILASSKVTNPSQTVFYKSLKKQILSLEATIEEIKRTISTLSLNSNAVGESVSPSRIHDNSLIGLIEKQERMEREIQTLITRSYTPQLTPTICCDTEKGRSPPQEPPSLGLRSVEDAISTARCTLITLESNKEPCHAVCIGAVSALCATLQRIGHLYNMGTGSFGGELEVIFSSPPSSLPYEIGAICREYICRHSAEELRWSLQVLNINQQTGKTLRRCYRWIQSHVLAYVSSLEGQPTPLGGAGVDNFALAYSGNVGPTCTLHPSGSPSAKRSSTLASKDGATQTTCSPFSEIKTRGAVTSSTACVATALSESTLTGCAMKTPSACTRGRGPNVNVSAVQHLCNGKLDTSCPPTSSSPLKEVRETNREPANRDAPDSLVPSVWQPCTPYATDASQVRNSQSHNYHSLDLSLISGIQFPPHTKRDAGRVHYPEQYLSDRSEYPALVSPSASWSHTEPRGKGREKSLVESWHPPSKVVAVDGKREKFQTVPPAGGHQLSGGKRQCYGCDLRGAGGQLPSPTLPQRGCELRFHKLADGDRVAESDNSASFVSNRDGPSQGLTASLLTPTALRSFLEPHSVCRHLTPSQRARSPLVGATTSEKHLSPFSSGSAMLSAACACSSI